ncbi:hypothetical protein SDC9_65925 [bioreactor metagenome]|uniref:Uncharacterized protein n=1 Tax=bioreactor metagenome TaxID=1076179 RepID=A0A644XTT5_9ZZZZ
MGILEGRPAAAEIAAHLPVDVSVNIAQSGAASRQFATLSSALSALAANVAHDDPFANTG